MFSVAAGISSMIVSATPAAMAVCKSCEAGISGGQEAINVTAQNVGTAVSQGAGQALS